jgi:DNA-binding MarR family transcriptional regulator
MIGTRMTAEFGINPTMLSRIIGKLETAGLLARRPDPSDGRAVRVEVTDLGAELHDPLRRERAELFEDRLAGLPEGQAARLLAALAALEALAEQLADRPARR